MQSIQAFNIIHCANRTKLKISILKSVCKSLKKVCYHNYIALTESSLRDNVRGFWKFVNGRKGKSCIPAVMHFGDIRSTAGDDIVNLFAKYVSKMYSDRDYAVQDTLASGDANLSKFEISISSIYEKLSL